MRLTLIACDVFTREVCRFAALSPHTIDLEFTKLGSHDQPGILRSIIQSKIDAAEETPSEAILLGYGLCGNAVNGLVARSKNLVLPRAHDCCTIFLGSKEIFNGEFGEHPSAGWGSESYIERSHGEHKEAVTGKIPGAEMEFAQLVEQYGEENAQYVWDTLHPPERETVRFWIEMPDDLNNGRKHDFIASAEENGKEIRLLKGNPRLIEHLLSGVWDEDEFLVVPAGCEVEALYDRESVIGIRNAPPTA